MPLHLFSYPSGSSRHCPQAKCTCLHQKPETVHARQGLPRKFVSNNSKTFKAANKAINVLMQSEEVERFLSGIMVEWQFNLAKAPWWGGMFEWLVQMVKRCLKKMIGRARLTYDELSTVIIKVEGVINSRPLCYVWQFNLAKAPWWGDMFEWLVQMVKRCLKKMIGRARLTYDELSTVIIEVEGVINSRPHCYVTPDDLDQPITPAHLLSG